MNHKPCQFSSKKEKKGKKKKNPHLSQERDLKKVPPCPYKGNSSQKEVSTVNVMCFTARSSMALRVDIIAFSEVEKQEGCVRGHAAVFLPPASLTAHNSQ